MECVIIMIIITVIRQELTLLTVLHKAGGRYAATLAQCRAAACGVAASLGRPGLTFSKTANCDSYSNINMPRTSQLG